MTLFKQLLMLLIFSLLLSCQEDDSIRNNNNQNIPNVGFTTGNLINTNLPQYNNLKFPGNSITLNNNYGVNGVSLYFTGSNYVAFELSDPNHQLTNCSELSLKGIIATCKCDDNNSYNIVNGIQQKGTTGSFTLKPYNVEVFNNIIRVSN